MVNYGEGLIYKICCKDASITDEYIGSTTNKNRRKQQHKTSCNNPNSKIHNLHVYQFIRNNGGFDNFDLIVIEEYHCESKRQLEMKEREWIELLKPTLNKNIPTRSKQEYYEENKEQIIEYNKQYKEQNKEQILEYQKQHYEQYQKQYKEQNKEKILDDAKRYYQQNKEKLNQKFNCECGGKYTFLHKSKHIKTQKHIKYFEELNL
jgi:hypothetical protein